MRFEFGLSNPDNKYLLILMIFMFFDDFDDFDDFDSFVWKGTHLLSRHLGLRIFFKFVKSYVSSHV